MKRLLGPLLALSLLAACRSDEARAARLRAEKQVLERQIAGLTELIAAAEARTLLAPGQLLVGADEATVQGLIAAALPQQRVVAKQFLLRVSSVEARFRASQGMIVLKGRASPVASPDTFAEVTLEGGLDEMEVRKSSGTLVARVAIDHLRVERAAAAGAEAPGMRALAEALGRERLEALSELVPPVEIPIRLEESIAFDSFEEGPISAGAGTLPVRASVARVVALAGRLWVVLDVGVGPWRAGKKSQP